MSGRHVSFARFEMDNSRSHKSCKRRSPETPIGLLRQLLGRLILHLPPSCVSPTLLILRGLLLILALLCLGDLLAQSLELTPFGQKLSPWLGHSADVDYRAHIFRSICQRHGVNKVIFQVEFDGGASHILRDQICERSNHLAQGHTTFSFDFLLKFVCSGQTFTKD